MLDLDARVHLDEDVLAGALPGRVDEELDGARVHVADRLGEGDGVAVERCAQLVVEVRRRRDLDDLLVTTLHRAVPLEQVHGVTRRVGEDLHLDVARPHHGLLEEDAGVAERGAGLAHRLGDRGRQLRRRLDAAHAAPAAAGDGLDEDREADVGGLRDERVDVVGRLGRAQHGHARGDRVLLRGDLVARHLERLRRRSDEGDAVLGGARGELAVLGEESVAGVDRVGAGLQRDADDLVDIEVCAHGMTRLADHVGLVRLLPMERAAVLVREHRDGAGSQFVRGAEGSDGDLTAVGDQDLAEHAHLAGQAHRIGLSVLSA